MLSANGQMKQILTTILLLIGAVGYQQFPIVSIILLPGTEISAAYLYELRDDSIRIDGERWIHLQTITALVHHVPGMPIRISTMDEKIFIMEDFQIREDHSLSGEGYEEGYREVRSKRTIQRSEILSIRNHMTVNYMVPSFIGGLLGCATAFVVVREKRLELFSSGGRARACADIRESALGCAAATAIGGLAGAGIAFADADEPNTYDLSGLSLERRRQVIRMILP